MLFRLKIEFDPLIREMFENIPDEFWEDSSKTFFDPAMGGGQFLAMIQDILRHKYNKSDEEIASRLSGMATNKFTLNYAVSKHKLLGTYYFGDFLKKEFDMKFDCIVGNPPYQGKKELHQQFFNLSVELLNESGILGFIQPAVPIHNNKDILRSGTQKMISYLKKYECNIKISGANVFKNVGISTDLMITHLIKTKSINDKINKIEYKNGNIYENVDIKNISMTEVPPNIYGSISKKYFDYIIQHGSLDKISKYGKQLDNLCSIAQIRGHRDSNDGTLLADYFTFFSKNDPQKTETNFGLDVQKKPSENIYSYLEKIVPRFGLALTKFNTNNHMGEMKSVPLVDFNQKYSDEDLFKMLKLTKEEIIEIKKIIQPWNHYGEE